MRKLDGPLPAVDPGRKGDWLQTYSGRSFYPLDPRPEEICIGDIAHALAHTCRYGGHTWQFYSVAEHSVIVSNLVPSQDALWGLMHDAAEAYLGDVVRPFKQSLPAFKAMEAEVMSVIAQKFGLVGEEPASVKYFDAAICADERQQLMNPCNRTWVELPPATGKSIEGLRPESARKYFLERFKRLTGQREFWT